MTPHPSDAVYKVSFMIKFAFLERGYLFFNISSAIVRASYSLAFSISRLHKQVIIVFLLIAFVEEGFCDGWDF